MFCYNCGNKVESAPECPFCHKILPPLNRTLEENALKNLREQENESSTDNGDFIPGEVPVYEKYKFERKHTFFGLMRIVGSILKIFADSDSSENFPYHWQGAFTEIQIHKDRILIKQYKNFWIPPTPYLKKYGTKEYVLMSKEINSLVKINRNLFAIKFGDQEVKFQTQDGFSHEGLLYNLRAVNPQIQFTV